MTRWPCADDKTRHRTKNLPKLTQISRLVMLLNKYNMLLDEKIGRLRKLYTFHDKIVH